MDKFKIFICLWNKTKYTLQDKSNNNKEIISGSIIIKSKDIISNKSIIIIESR
jgi:hypothetical protein